MSLYFTQENYDDIKKYYKYSLDNQSAREINTHLRVLFLDRLSELNILLKFKEFKENLSIKEKMSQKMSIKNFMMKFLMNIMILYLLEKLEYKSKEISNKTGKNGIYNINKENLDNVVEPYIKLDKNYIKNKINDLISLII